MKKEDLRLFISALVIALMIPLVNIVLLGSLRITFASDITFPEMLPVVLSYLSGVIDIACLFASYACLAFAIVARKKRLAITLIVGAAAPLAYIASCIVDAAFFGMQILTPAYLLYCANSCLYELLRFGTAMLVFWLIAGRANKKHLPCELHLLSSEGTLSLTCVFTAVVIALSMLVSNVIETITLLLEFGAPINATEVITLISPYITTVVFAILGYFLAYAVMHMLQSKPHERKVRETIDNEVIL